MSYQKDARKILFETMENLAKKEDAEFKLFNSKWSVVEKNLSDMIEVLANKGVLTKDQAFKMDEFKKFLKESKQQVTKYSNVAAEIIEDGQVDFMKAGLKSSQEMIELITPKFNHLSVDATNVAIGLTRDGSPINKILMESYPKSVSKLTDILINSTAIGRNPIETARLMAKQMDGNKTRAMLIARTEQMNIMRESSLIQMKKSGVVKGWQWLVTKDDLACEDCESNDGQQFDLDEPMSSHPNCRCCPLPLVG
jgi:SPP1 gp7 family putative phage head morphogenesis protein